jgi:hypothetical protein
MEFWLSRSLSHELFLFHDGIPVIKEPLTQTFSFSWWNSGYQGASHTNFFFFMIEFWLSSSLSYELFLFRDGILAIKEPLTQTFSFFIMEFCLSRSLWHELFLFHDGILAIKEPLTQTFSIHDRILAIKEPFIWTFSFSWWNSSYQGAFHTNFYFTRWNLSYHEAFSRIFHSHGGISAIMKPFHEFFFHMVESRLSRCLFTNFSFTWWNLGYHEAFHTMESTKCMIRGKTLFIYFTKSIYIGSASLKTLSLDLEPHLQGKEYGPPYSNKIAKRKANVFSSKITYRSVIRFIIF